MAQLYLGTDRVGLDEPCLVLREEHMQSPGSRGWRRYRIIQVVRNDKAVEYRKDLGPAESFRTPQFRIPGGGVDPKTGKGQIIHTVGQLIEIAEGVHAQGIRDIYLPKETEHVVDRYFDAIEEQARWRAGASTSGPNITVQRSS